MKYLIIPVLLGLGLAGCSQAKSDEAVAATEQAPAQPSASISAPATAARSATTREAQSGATESVATAKAQPGHSVAYQAELKMAVDDFDKATDRVNELLERHGAYLGSAHETRAEGQRRQEMMLQVPPRQFVALVSALGRLGHIENKDITAADITADALAAAAQLDEQQAAEAQTRQQLARAGTPAERARLESEMRRQRAETGTTQAQLHQFGARATWAALTLRYYQVLPAAEPSAPQPPVAPRFRQAFGWGWALLMELAVGLAYTWPALLLAALGAWGLRRWRLRQSLPA
ncbi:hypothetical protein GCM10022409_02090 [Hymenobacter glaciei]|uniref:DUF4349 domain-containing protein n=1 Tax=Hymenobacter glaciei TaxID=877209 RepID=A0ABP7T7R6_9BACT